ncbi:WD40/YVTN/BNR-like repeat-containing protein [Paenibacillus contaminans]|uniref:Sortilin N-terminal domain-containing protein n=1 Tax=Paenibacillus contaminans TaxID=450362 RepID=A0A329LK26_9BACL|nr:hypothetical protein [Paenibacillus contaminans]RAV08301.1 hypothetical protein DQG23_41240 [Paenibacillus contaminans]
MAKQLSNRRDRWEIIGPGGGGGQFLPTVSPHDPNLALIACDMTGAYITRDGGRSWRHFHLRTVVSSFRFDPVNPDVIYAGSSSAGLFRSEDKGETWRLIFPDPDKVTDERMVGDHSSNIWVSSDAVWPGAAKITAVQIDREQTNQLYVGLHMQGSEEERRTTTIYFSVDRGKSWTELFRANGAAVHGIHIDTDSPRERRRLYVFTDSGVYTADSAFRGGEPEAVALPRQVRDIHHACAARNPTTGNTVFFFTAAAEWEEQVLVSGVWKSDDKGQSWKPVNSVISRNHASPVTRLLPEFTLLGASELDSRTLYLGAAQYPEIAEESGAGAIIESWGFLKSVDEGESWEWVLKSDSHVTAPNLKGSWVENNYTPSWNGIGPKGIAPLGVGVHAADPRICYATDMGSTYRTLDGGETWEQVYADEYPDGSVSSRGLDVTTCYGVHFDPFDRSHIAISYTDIGCFHSLNGGRTWRHSIGGMTPAWGNTCYWLVFDPDVRGRVWGAWGSAHDLPRPKMMRSGRFRHYEGGVGKSDDGLVSWRRSNAGMPENSVTTYLALDPSSPPGNRTLYAAVFDKGVYKSTDDGNTWTLKNSGISGNFNAWRIVMLPDSTLYLLVARGLRRGKAVDGALYRSIDGAESWERLDLPDGANAPNDLVFDPGNPKRMALACWPRTIDGEERDGGVYATGDGGASWRSIFDSSKHVYGIAIDPNRPSTMFINTFDNGAYRTDDRGETWKRLKGYNFKWGHSPFIDPYRENMLYLTTFGSSVWHGPDHGDDEAFEDIYPIGALK